MKLPLLALTTLLLACTSSQRTGTRTPAVPGPTTEELAALSIPPGAGSENTLRALELKADKGSVEAAWQRAHYLIDLFDATRFGGDEASRALLAEVAGRPLDAMRGPAATQAIAELLVLEVDHVLELERRHALALQAQTLVRIDATDARNRTEVFQRMQELKRIAQDKAAMAAGARLRLFAYCRSALEDAREFIGPARRIALSHCLYPLYDADPEPYFHLDASKRPPPPVFETLHLRLASLLGLRDDASRRLAAAFQVQLAWLAEFGNAVNQARFASIDPIAARLPSVDIAPPSDDYPVIKLSGKAEDETKRLRKSLMMDGRRIASVALAAQEGASKALAAAQMAAKAGAQEISYLVAVNQRLSVPKGDYWSERLTGDSVTRLGDLKMSLALMGAGKSPGESSEARVGQWDPGRSELKLHLLISPKRWRLVSPAGEIAVITTDVGHPRVALWSVLLKLQSAYPDETGIVLVPSEDTSHGTLIMVAEAARHDPDGVKFLADLALGNAAPVVKKGKALKRRIERRAAAKVSVVPEILAPRLPIARRCYLQSLTNPGKAPVGEIRMDIDASGKLTLSNPGSPLADCAARAFAGPMGSQKIPAVSVSFGR